MVNGQKRRKRRRPRKGSKARRQSSQNPFIVQAIGAIILIVLVIFLVPLGIIPDTNIAIAICMLILGGMFYLMFVSNPKPRKRRRKKAKKSKSDSTEPQFYTALPSTLGLTEIPEQVPTPQVKLPPRPIRAARRRRDFVTYPLSVGGGAYSDSYVQVDKDTVLRLRSEMAPELQSIKLGGPRISSFPSAREASVMSKEASPVAAEPVVAETSPVAAEPVVAETSPVAAEPVVAEASPVAAEPVVAEASPVAAETMGAETTVPVEAGIAQTATPIQSTAADEEEEELEFDMEWD
jgi:hypothetical protein